MEYRIYIVLVMSLIFSTEIVGDSSTTTEYSHIAIKSDIDHVKSLISAQDATIARQFTTIANLRADIAGQNAKIAQQDATIANLRANIAEQNTKIAQQDTTISGHTTKIAQQDIAVVNLSAEIAEHNNKIVKQEIGIQSLQQNWHNMLHNVSKTQTEHRNEIMELETLLRNTTSRLNGEDKKLNRESHKIINASRCLNTTLQTLKGRDKGGAVYIRWGHDRCPNSSKLIFSGFAAGGRYDTNGGGVDTLCLPQNLTLPADQTQYRSYSSVYKTEYQLRRSNGDRLPSDSLTVPCSVCQSKFRITSLMISGRSVCPDEWHQEYRGLLMAGHSSDESSTLHVCIDNDMKPIPTIGTNQNRRYLYPVVANLYQDGQTLTCIVCTS